MDVECLNNLGWFAMTEMIKGLTEAYVDFKNYSYSIMRGC